MYKTVIIIQRGIYVCFRLRSSHLKFKFVTNTTKESKRVLLERIRTIGFDVQDHEVFTSLTAARDLVATRGLSPLLLVDDKALEDFQGTCTCTENCVQNILQLQD